MKIINLIQGTPDWHAHRAQHHNASDAPAMMGCSPYKTRAQLLREVATGVAQEVDAATQRRFDDGHRFEDLARPLAEQIIGEELFPVTGTNGKLSASFDGLTMDGETAFEHKSLNDQLRQAMRDELEFGGDLPLHYQVQMEQQLLVSGAERVLFMASKWNGEELVEERHCWYVSNAELRAKIVAGWKQYEVDVAAYEPEAPAALVATGSAPDQMPALRIEVTGMVTASNLAEWKEQAIAVFQNISKDLVTDQDFADAEKTVKWCGDIEDQLKGAKQHALSQTESIDALFRTIDAISEQARSTRLALDKLVTKRKEERRTEIGNAARRAVQDHVRAINDTLGEHGLQMPSTLVADIAAAMKGKRSFASMQEAVDTVATNAKIDASQAADRIRANIAIIVEQAEYSTLFADRVQLCATKAPDDLRNLVATRIAAHKQAEQEKLDAACEKIREEEAAKARKQLADEALAKQKQEDAERVAAASVPSTTVQHQQAVESLLVSRPAAVASAPPTTSTGKRIKLGEINAAISPLSITADGLELLGFKPVALERSAKLYDVGQLPGIYEAMRSLIVDAEHNYPLAA
ncbi:hypothetical protein ABB26_10135 [Stenotrophomonas humi]|uniref:YqaJ viral recombinase domain-containing protein n=1 Tax=Stenotrophomonas humi TaxID=405444 RepID=A0A0R0C311_9GAMM|nr:YqaJ viral recombinase family protein [Stenotrophomonas humi]KRG63925.1 hypothetical protein ABB26_10135 [Stenotrophomonas humi]